MTSIFNTPQNNRQNSINFDESDNEEFLNLMDIQDMYGQDGKQYYNDFNNPQQRHNINMPNVSDIPLSPQMMQMMHNPQSTPQRPEITPEMMMSLIKNMTPDMMNTLLMQQLSQHQGFNYDFLSQRNELVDKLNRATMLNDLSGNDTDTGINTDTDLINDLSGDDDEDYADTDTTPETSDTTDNETSTPMTAIAIKDGAMIWGDPHFVGADGEKYDVHGTAGKTYNILSDKNLQFNATFEQYKDKKDINIMDAAGITIDNHKISISADGKIMIDNKEITAEGVYLDDRIEKGKDSLTIHSDEYDLIFKPKDKYLNVDFISDNTVADNVLPSGLWGLTVDADDIAKNGDTGADAQGGGVLIKKDGTIAAAGDKETVKDYEVSNIFDTTFSNFNKFN